VTSVALRWNVSFVDARPSSTPATLEDLLVSNLGLIRRIAAHSARYLRPQDAEDFASEVIAKLIENDYDILAKFQRRSSLSTYLYKVIHRMYVDHQVKQWGKWRASAEARRLGQAAVRLEVLLVRDGLTLDQAVEVLRTNGGVPISEHELRALSLRLPHRPPRRSFVAEEVLAQLARECPEIEADLLRRESEPAARQTEEALREIVAGLPPQDRIILRLHCEESFSWTDIAGFLKVKQRALYDRKDRLLNGIQEALTRRGIHSGVLDLLRDGDWDLLVSLE